MNFINDYFYGNEADQFTFYRIPKVLFTEPRFKTLSAEAKILYGLMLDRMGLSIKNNWRDEQNKVYIYFALEDIQEYINCGHTKGVKILAELDSKNGVGLIERIRQAQGKPTKIYVKKFILDSVVLLCKTHSVPSCSGFFPIHDKIFTTTKKDNSYPLENQNIQKTDVQLPQMRSQDLCKTKV